MTRIIEVSMEDQELFAHIIDIRRKVFVLEQHCTEESEWDDEEIDARYLLAYYKDIPCATLRWREIEGRIKMERVSVLIEYRGLGIGEDIVRHGLKIIETLDKEVYLHSQEDVISFYEKLDFVAEGKRFYEERIPHFAMKLKKREENT